MLFVISIVPFLSAVAIAFLYESGFWMAIISGGRLFQGQASESESDSPETVRVRLSQAQSGPLTQSVSPNSKYSADFPSHIGHINNLRLCVLAPLNNRCSERQCHCKRPLTLCRFGCNSYFTIIM